MAGLKYLQHINVNDFTSYIAGPFSEINRKMCIKKLLISNQKFNVSNWS